MSAIPKDVMVAARRAVADLSYDHIDPLGRKAATVARAIMAERNRCAKVARTCAIEVRTLGLYEPQVETARQYIAAAIEAGT